MGCQIFMLQRAIRTEFTARKSKKSLKIRHDGGRGPRRLAQPGQQAVQLIKAAKADGKAAPALAIGADLVPPESIF